MSVVSVERLGQGPMPTDSPFLFAVYHLDKYPPGDARMAPAASLRGHNIGADFGHADGWSMYHGETVPGFPKHPHRGFETITIARRGFVDHTDSLGNGGRFGGGDLQWMTAGEGISHAEMFPCLDTEAPNVLDLFQIWLNLPKRSKMAPPTFKMLWAEQIPKRTEMGGAVELALYVGTFPDMATPPPPPSHSYAAEAAAAVLVMTITLSAGASWTLPAATGGAGGADVHRSLYQIEAGSSSLIDGHEVTGRQRVKLRAGSAAPLVNRDPERPLQLLLLQGKDIGEPVVQHGPFVGNTRQDIMAAFQDYQRTGFGAWPWPSDAHAFPRDRPRFAQYADGTLEERPREAVCAQK